MKHKTVFAVLFLAALLALVLPTAAAALELNGNGTEESPWELSSVSDWNALAADVAGGNSHKGEYFLMTADIGTDSEPVTTIIGCQTGTQQSTRKRFAGAFDGGGNVLTVALTSDPSYPNYCSPFAYVEYASFRNLTVKGTVTASGQFGSGLVGQSGKSDDTTGGVCTVENCTISVNIISAYASQSGKYANHAGVIGIAEGVATITDTVFNGSFSAVDGGDFNESGGFIGLNKVEGSTLTGCWFDPEYVDETAAGSHNTEEFAHSAKHYAPICTDCYYTCNFGDSNADFGVELSTEEPEWPYAVVEHDGRTYYTTDVVHVTVVNDGTTESEYYAPRCSTIELPLIAGASVFAPSKWKEADGTLYESGATLVAATDLSFTLEAADAVSAKFYHHKMTLSGDIDLKFEVIMPAPFQTANKDGYMIFTLDGDASDPIYYADIAATETTATDPYDNTVYSYWFTCHLNPLQLADEVTAVFYDNTGEAVATDTFSAMAYFDAARANEKLSANTLAMNVIDALQNYGHYLQLTGITDNAGHTNVPIPAVEDKKLDSNDIARVTSAVSDKAVVKPDFEADIKFALTVNSQTKLQVFLEKKDGLTVSTPSDGIRKINGVDYYVFSTATFGPRLLSTPKTITIETSDGNVAVSGSALSYVNAWMSQADDGTDYTQNWKLAMAALYDYSAAADECPETVNG